MAVQLTPLQAQQVLVLWLLLTASTTDDNDLIALESAIDKAVATIPGAGDLFEAYITDKTNRDDRAAVSAKLNTFLGSTFSSSKALWGAPQCPRSAQVIMNMFDSLPGLGPDSNAENTLALDGNVGTKHPEIQIAAARNSAVPGGDL